MLNGPHISQAIRSDGAADATKQEQDAYSLHEWTAPTSIELSGAQSHGLRQQYDLKDDWSQELQTLTPAFESFLQWHGGPQGDVA